MQFSDIQTKHLCHIFDKHYCFTCTNGSRTTSQGSFHSTVIPVLFSLRDTSHACCCPRAPSMEHVFPTISVWNFQLQFSILSWLRHVSSVWHCLGINWPRAKSPHPHMCGSSTALILLLYSGRCDIGEFAVLSS